MMKLFENTVIFSPHARWAGFPLSEGYGAFRKKRGTSKSSIDNIPLK